MRRVGLYSPSPSGFSLGKQVFRKMSSITRSGNLALSDCKVTVTAARQLSLGWWWGGAQVSDCESGDRKISIALNEEPEPRWGNSTTAPLRWSKPSGDVWLCPSHVPRGWGHPSHGPQRAAQPCHHPWWWILSNPGQTRHGRAFYHWFPLLQLEYATGSVWMQSTPNAGVCPSFGGAVYLYLVAVKQWLQTPGTVGHLGFISSSTPI